MKTVFVTGKRYQVKNGDIVYQGVLKEIAIEYSRLWFVFLLEDGNTLTLESASPIHDYTFKEI